MPDDFKKFGKRIERVRGKIQRGMAVAVLRGGTIIQLRAKEIIQEKGHIRTGTLRRSITVQLGSVTKTEATALIGSSVVYAASVEYLPEASRKGAVSFYDDKGRLRKFENRGEGGGYLFPAAEEKLAAAIAEAGRSLEQSMKEGARG